MSKEYLVTVNKPVDGDFVKKIVIWNSYSGYHYPPVFCGKNREKFFSDHSHPGIEQADPPNV